MFDWITGWLGQSGLFGVFALMLGENVFPPVPSEFVMPLAGFLVAQGELSLPLVILAGTLGSALGALLWYYVGLWIGTDRLCRFAGRDGRWLTISEREVSTAIRWFERWGWWAVFFGRMVPGVRTLISVPAGLARMRLLPFLAITFAGSLLWTAALTFAGFVLEAQYQSVSTWLNPVTNVILASLVALYLWRLIAGHGKKA